MKVAYVTPFYNGRCEGRFGRFHDWLHTLRDMDNPPFEFDVHAVMAANPDGTLASTPSEWLGPGDELYGTKRNNLQYLSEIRRIRRDLRETHPDVVHLIAFDVLLLPSVLGTGEDVPMVLGPNVGGWFPIREDDIWFDDLTDRVRHRAKYLIRKGIVPRLDCERVCAFSQYHRRMLELIGVRQSEISVLRPGVDSRFSPEPDPETPTPPYELLYVGALSDHKGYPLFLRAVSQLETDIRIRVVGGGDPRRSLLRSLGLTNIVSVEGFVKREDLPKFYRSADLFVLPTIDETAGTNTQFESLACGTPVVATDSDAISEFGRGKSVNYFWPRKPAALATAIEATLSEISEATRAARDGHHEYSALRTVEQLENLYAEVVKE